MGTGSFVLADDGLVWQMEGVGRGTKGRLQDLSQQMGKAPSGAPPGAGGAGRVTLPRAEW